jgi:prepilin-type N-terminal cleavage/methylation domain-containing protein
MSTKKGFTLVELLVVVVCVGILMTALFKVFFQEQRIVTAEQEILEMQMNARVALDRVLFAFQHSGFGCLNSFSSGQTMTGVDPDGNTVTIDSAVWDIQDNAPGNGTVSDSVVLVYGFRKIGEVQGEHEETDTVDLKNIGSPACSTSGFNSYISFFPSFQGDMFYKVSSFASTIYSLDQEVAYLPDDAEVFMVTPVRLTVIDSTLYMQNYVYSSNSNAQGLWEVAENIENMQIEYGTNGEEATVYLLARTVRPDPEHVDDRVYQLGDVTVGPFNDNHHRMVCKGTVRIRSMS